MDNREAELYLNQNDAYSKKLKAQAFDIRVDKIRESAKKANSPEEKARFSKLERSSIDIVHKYRQVY